MANRFWVGGTATWDATAGTKWATTSGGGGGAAVPTSSDAVFFDGASGAITVTTSGSSTDTCLSIDFTGFTGTFDHASGTTVIVAGSATFVSGMTYTVAETSILQFTAAATLTTGGKLIAKVQQSSNSALTLGDNLSFAAFKTCSLNLVSALASLNMNGFSISGNSATNRVLILSNTIGSAKSITNATTSFSNADFRDITFSSASSLDLSAITGLSGDCGGNTITGGGSTLTFTTGATQTVTGSTGNWSTASWSGRVPLPQDDVVISLTAGQTLTADMPRIGKSISFGTSTNFTMTLAHTMYGSLDLTGMGTLIESVSSLDLEGRTAGLTVTSAGKSHTRAFRIASIGGTYTFQDAFSSSNTLQHSSGTLTVSNFSVTASTYTGNLVVGTTRITNPGNGTWTISGQSTIWDTSLSGHTWNQQGETIYLTSIAAATKTFAGGGKTFYALKIAAASVGSDIVVITGANTFNQIYTDGGGTKAITLPGSATTTIVSSQGLNNGTNVITFTASAGSATVAKSGGGTVQWNYVNLTNIPASTTNTWYAGTNSTDGGGNTNWLFQDAPVSARPNKMCLMGIG